MRGKSGISSRANGSHQNKRTSLATPSNARLTAPSRAWVGRKWCRNGLKRLIPGPEMARGGLGPALYFSTRAQPCRPRRSWGR
jgi:hypothetical protein